MHSTLSHDIIGEDVLITGAGPIGLMAIKICKMIGARNVVITDINDYRLLLAESFGASKAININKEDLKSHYSELKMINGFDVGLEMSGSPSALDLMLCNMHHGGKFLYLDFCKINKNKLDDIILKELL